MGKERLIKFWLVCGLLMLTLSCLGPRIARALEDSAPNPKDEESVLPDAGKIPFFNRFKLKDKLDSTGFDDEERRSIYYGYKEGRVSEEDYSKFYSSTEKPNSDQSWKRVSFAVYDKPDSKVRLDVSPKDKSMTLNYALRLYTVK